jgi:tripartite-type tricarboxylate transporter receptor subunit TctC
MSRVLSWIGAALVCAAQATLPAMAQEFPKKQPIKIVIATQPGGATDVLARITAEFLQRRLEQTVIVEAKPGASGTIGADYVAKAPADGYTIFLAGSEFAAVPAVRATPYKFDEMTFLVRGFLVPPMMIASPKFQPSSLKELVEYMKANPGQARYGSTGIGAIVHMGMAMFEGAAGVKGLHIPYTGIAPVYTDLLGGQIDVSQAAPPYPDGIKVIGSIGSKRNPVWPNLPTLEEIGVKGATWDQWFGVMAPPNLPKPIADRLIAELSAVFKDPQAIAKYTSTAKYEPDPSPLTGTAFKQQVVEENKRWKAVVDREKIVVQ